MARISIYVSDELKRDMESFGEVNWSAIAQAAFRDELARRSAFPSILIEAQKWLS